MQGSLSLSRLHLHMSTRASTLIGLVFSMWVGLAGAPHAMLRGCVRCGLWWQSRRVHGSGFHFHPHGQAGFAGGSTSALEIRAGAFV